MLAGCGARTGTLSGTVRYQGDKVASGTVAFVVAGKSYRGEIKDGAYTVAGVPPGEARVTVVRIDPSQPDPYEALTKARKQMLAKKLDDPRDVDAAVVTDTTKLEAQRKKRHLLPYRYSSADRTDLRFTVAAGAHRFDIELQPDPE